MLFVCLIKIPKYRTNKRSLKKLKKLKLLLKKCALKVNKLKQLIKLFFKNFFIISNLLTGLLNPFNKVFVKTINYAYVTYWTLFGYNTEKYYTLKNSYLPQTQVSFLKISSVNTSKQFTISNMINLKKISVGFNIPEKNYKTYMDSFLRSNSFENINGFQRKIEIIRKFRYEEEKGDTNVWVDNNFKYKTKLLITNQRRVLCSFFKFNLKRQYRITPWISNFLKWKTKSVVNFFDLLLINVLINSKLVLNFNQAIWFIKHSCVYVNGHPQTKTDFFLKKMDIVQLIFSNTYTAFYANYFNYLFKANNKFVNKFSRKISENQDWDLGYYLARRSRVPKLFSRIALFKQPIPPYLEVDFLTLSTLVIYVPFGFNFTFNTNHNYYNYYLARLYNWKFRS